MIPFLLGKRLPSKKSYLARESPPRSDIMRIFWVIMLCLFPTREYKAAGHVEKGTANN